MWSLLLGVFTIINAPAAQSIYTVKKGDTLFDIAKANHLTVGELAARNGLKPTHLVRIGERLTIGSSDKIADTLAPEETSYVVKRGDTLFDLARANHLAVAELARRNGLDKDYQLKIGERLILPAAAHPAPALPADISGAIRNAPVTMGRWKYIVIHHSGVDEGTVKGMDRYHREVRHMENGLAYHFVIGNGHGMGDGEIAVGHRWKKQLDGGHLRSLAQDKVAIGICLVGNFDKAPPTTAEMKSLNALVRALMERCHISADNVKTHRQINIISTRCPGSKFPTRSFLAGLQQPAAS